MLEVASTIKNLFREYDNDDDKERKFAFTNLHLHSRPCVRHIVNLIKTISSEEDLAVFQGNDGLKDKYEDNMKDATVSQQTERKVEFWNNSMDEMFKTVHDYVHEVMNTEEKRNIRETIQAARQVVASLAKENLMLKEALKVNTESDEIFKKQNTLQLSAIEEVLINHRQEVSESSARLISMEQTLDRIANRPTVR